MTVYEPGAELTVNPIPDLKPPAPPPPPVSVAPDAPPATTRYSIVLLLVGAFNTLKVPDDVKV